MFVKLSFCVVKRWAILFSGLKLLARFYNLFIAIYNFNIVSCAPMWYKKTTPIQVHIIIIDCPWKMRTRLVWCKMVWVGIFILDQCVGCDSQLDDRRKHGNMYLYCMEISFGSRKHVLYRGFKFGPKLFSSRFAPHCLSSIYQPVQLIVRCGYMRKPILLV